MCLGLVSICLLAFMSYCTVTFIIETQSIHNAFLRHKLKLENANIGGNSEGVSLDNIIIQNSNTTKEYNNDSVDDGVCVGGGGEFQPKVIDINTTVEEIFHDDREDIVENPEESLF